MQNTTTSSHSTTGQLCCNTAPHSSRSSKRSNPADWGFPITLLTSPFCTICYGVRPLSPSTSYTICIATLLKLQLIFPAPHTKCLCNAPPTPFPFYEGPCRIYLDDLRGFDSIASIARSSFSCEFQSPISPTKFSKPVVPALQPRMAFSNASAGSAVSKPVTPPESRESNMNHADSPYENVPTCSHSLRVPLYPDSFDHCDQSSLADWSAAADAGARLLSVQSASEWETHEPTRGRRHHLQQPVPRHSDIWASIWWAAASERVLVHASPLCRTAAAERVHGPAFAAGPEREVRRLLHSAQRPLNRTTPTVR